MKMEQEVLTTVYTFHKFKHYLVGNKLIFL
jgi:hypothetical protein